MPVSFTTPRGSEWFTVDTVERILSMPRVDILALVQSGKLRGRLVSGEVRIDAASVDAYSATRPLFSKPEPPTYEKTRHGVRLLIE